VSFLFPNFVASASVTSLSAPGLTSSPTDRTFELPRGNCADATGVEIGLGGKLSLLGSLTFVTTGRFIVDLSAGGGIFGEIQMLVDGSLATNATLSGTGNLYSLNGSFFLELNTTSTARTIDLPNVASTDDPVLAPVSAQLARQRIAGGWRLHPQRVLPDGGAIR